MSDLRACSWVLSCCLLASLAMACGSDSDGDGASCEAFTACGGDPIGTWQSKTTCLPDGFEQNLVLNIPDECRSAFVLDDIVSNTTLTIGGVSFTEQGNTALQWSMDFGEECISAAAGGAAVGAAEIAVFCDAFQTSISGTDGGFDEVTCDASDTSCSCDAHQSQTIDQTSALTIDTTELVYAGNLRQQFCVRGNQLELEAIPGQGVDGAHIVYEHQ